MHDPNLGSVLKKKKNSNFFYRKIVLSFLILSCFSLSLFRETCLSKTGCMETSMKDNYSSRERMFALIQRSYMKHGIIFERVVMSEEIRTS